MVGRTVSSSGSSDNKTRGVHPSEAMIYFPSVSDFPSISEIFSESVENSTNFTFSKNHFPIFIRQNFWWFFLVIDSKFWIFPLFAVSVNFPLFRENYYFPRISLHLRVLHTVAYVFFVFPLVWPWCIYASHNARTGRPWKRPWDRWIVCWWKLQTWRVVARHSRSADIGRPIW